MSLLSTLRLAGRSADRNRRLRIGYESNTPQQRRWIEMRGRRILWRGPNQVGKSRALAKKMIHFVRATGPYVDRAPGPKKILVMSFSKEQMEPLHEKIWELLPKDEIGPGVEFEPGFGFRGKPPRIKFTSGPGKGSVIIFATYKQGSRRAAGGTFDIVILDEPVEERIWGEIQPRVLHGDPGEIWVTFTPTPDSPPLEYLRRLVEAGSVVEMPTMALSVDLMTLEDGRALLTQEQIDDFTGSLLELEKDMRLRGGWEIISGERVLDNWGPHCVGTWRGITGVVPPGSVLAVGMDHGAGSGKQASALVAIADQHGTRPRVWLLAEHVSEGFTTPDMDAAAVLDMISSVGLSYDDIDVWVGDRASGMNKYDVRKTNKDIRHQMARILKRDSKDLKFIDVPHKFDGSVASGIRTLNAMMGRRDDLVSSGDRLGTPHFLVSSACPRFAAAAAKWRGSPKDNLKDILDAVRYPVEKVVKAQVMSFQVNYS